MGDEVLSDEELSQRLRLVSEYAEDSISGAVAAEEILASHRAQRTALERGRRVEAAARDVIDYWDWADDDCWEYGGPEARLVVAVYPNRAVWPEIASALADQPAEEGSGG